MLSWHGGRRLLVAKHVKQRGLASIIETQEQNLCVLVPQSKTVQNVVEPIEPTHGEKEVACGVSEVTGHDLVALEPSDFKERSFGPSIEKLHCRGMDQSILIRIKQTSFLHMLTRRECLGG